MAPIENQHDTRPDRPAWWTISSAPLAIAPVAYWPRFPVTVTGGLLCVLLATVVVTDVRHRLIPNWATYPTFLWALVLNAIVSAVGYPSQLHWVGAVGFTESAAGGFGLLAITLALFSITGGGAGDVKAGSLPGRHSRMAAGRGCHAVRIRDRGIGILLVSAWAHGPLLLLTSLGTIHRSLRDGRCDRVSGPRVASPFESTHATGTVHCCRNPRGRFARPLDRLTLLGGGDNSHDLRAQQSSPTPQPPPSRRLVDARSRDGHGTDFSALVALFYLGVQAMHTLFTLIGTMVGSPLL